jgi:dihydroorotate dehydrogenase
MATTKARALDGKVEFSIISVNQEGKPEPRLYQLTPDEALKLRTQLKHAGDDAATKQTGDWHNDK